MKILYKVILLLLLITVTDSIAKDKEQETKNPVDINFSGFLRYDAIYDTRQSKTLRESAIMLYPDNERIVNGVDVNDNPALSMLVLHTRLRWDITGPDAFGAKTSAAVESEFFGASDFDVNGFRLRHAYINMDWGSVKLLMGQYWNPLFITDVLPSHNFCSPYIPYGRRPQIKLTEKLSEDISLSLTASSQSDFKSIGPGDNGQPAYSTKYIKNAAVPSLNFTAGYNSSNFIFGFGADYKKLKPVEEYNSLNSFAGTAFMKLSTKPLTLKVQGIYGQNLTDVVMLGGYAVKKDDSTSFTNYNTYSVWAEISTGKDLLYSLLFGYTKNLGTVCPAVRDLSHIYARGADIDNSLRIAPSVQVRSGRMKFIAEAEYTTAAYGTFKNDHLELDHLKDFSNIRFDIVAYYFL